MDYLNEILISLGIFLTIYLLVKTITVIHKRKNKNNIYYYKDVWYKNDWE